MIERMAAAIRMPRLQSRGNLENPKLFGCQSVEADYDSSRLLCSFDLVASPNRYD
jgi:hypothetical protein